MPEQIRIPDELVFGLDIGTRSIVGTVGFREKNEFHVVAQCTKEHETRAMMDGQIHDISKVGETISFVRQELEQQTGRSLNEVCIAAAGRVLKTVTAEAKTVFEEETVVTAEHIYSMDLLGIEKAQEELYGDNHSDIKFYCVGYSVVHYMLNDYQISNLEGHKAKIISEQLIATFLPEEVVDGLYAAVELAGLSVANLTLEPIAAISVAIPERFRLLNIGLVDIGAGTSDICITRDGSVIAYGMIPMAGDELTEIIARQYLVDFDMAEHIKKQVLACTSNSNTDNTQELQESEITYHDIIGIEHKLDPQEVCQLLDAVLEEETTKVAEKIIELNGDKSVSAVFLVGGGGKFPGYSKKLAKKLSILEERVALRGEEVLGQIHFYQQHVKKDSLLVTPIGICLNYYDKKNNFIFVNFNGERIKLFNNNHLTVVEAAMQAGFSNEGLFPKRGEALEFSINDKPRIIRGEIGEAAVITVNSAAADVNTKIHSNDKIVILPSTAGRKAEQNVGELPEFQDQITIIVNKRPVVCPKFVQVKEELVSEFYSIHPQDELTILNYYTLKQLLEFMDVLLPTGIAIYVNNVEGDMNSKVYDKFTVDWNLSDSKTEDSWSNLATADDTEYYHVEKKHDEKRLFELDNANQQQDNARHVTEEAGTATLASNESKNAGSTSEDAQSYSITVFVNNQPVQLSGKKKYIFVDVFDHIDFDLSRPHGSNVATILNGRKAQYMEPLQDKDILEIFWEE